VQALLWRAALLVYLLWYRSEWTTSGASGGAMPGSTTTMEHGRHQSQPVQNTTTTCLTRPTTVLSLDGMVSMSHGLPHDGRTARTQ
jgi:hypothetical protein